MNSSKDMESRGNINNNIVSSKKKKKNNYSFVLYID